MDATKRSIYDDNNAVRARNKLWKRLILKENQLPIVLRKLDDTRVEEKNTIM